LTGRWKGAHLPFEFPQGGEFVEPPLAGPGVSLWSDASLFGISNGKSQIADIADLRYLRSEICNSEQGEDTPALRDTPRPEVIIVAFDRQSWNYQPAGELTLMAYSAINAQPY